MNGINRKEAINYARAYWRLLHDPRELCYDASGKNLPDLIHPLKADAALAKLYVESLKDEAEVSTSAVTYDLLCEEAAKLLRDPEAPCPSWLRQFIADVLECKRRRPAKRGRDPNKNVLRNMRLALTVKEISKRFGIALYTKDKRLDTAAAIVSEATFVALDVVIHACQTVRGDYSRISRP